MENNPNAKKRSLTPINNDAFNESPIIRFMAEIPRWTISTKDKVPVSVPALKEQRVESWKPAFPGDISSLTTLSEINEMKELENANRTFRFDGNRDEKHPIICIDVEKTAEEHIVQEFMKLPVHYREYSKSGGFHLLLQVPKFCINEEHRYLFDLTVLQSEDRSFEVIFNRHFCTFTKKVIDTRIPNLLNPKSNDCQMIRDFLTYLVEMDKESAVKRELKNKAKAELGDLSESTLDESQLNTLLALIPKPAIKRAQDLTLEQYHHNHSQYEYNVVFQLAGGLMYGIGRAKNKDIEPKIGKPLEEITLMDMSSVLYSYMDQLITYRAKHEEHRNGLKWLHYIALEAMMYVKQTYKQKEKKAVPLNL